MGVSQMSWARISYAGSWLAKIVYTIRDSRCRVLLLYPPSRLLILCSTGSRCLAKRAREVRIRVSLSASFPCCSSGGGVVVEDGTVCIPFTKRL